MTLNAISYDFYTPTNHAVTLLCPVWMFTLYSVLSFNSSPVCACWGRTCLCYLEGKLKVIWCKRDTGRVSLVALRDGIKWADKRGCSNQGRRRWWNVYPSIRIIIMHSRQRASAWLLCMSVHACVCILYMTACVSMQVCAWLSVTLLHVVGSFLNPDDRVDFSCEWMRGLSYDGVHMHVPSLYRKWNSTGSLSLLADLPKL